MNNIRSTNHFIDTTGSTDDIAIINADFKIKILTHIIGNYSDSINTPLFLAIHGNSGEGKTFNTLRVCEEQGLKICYFSGAELSGNYERDSILDFEENYTRACNYYQNNEYSVIIIDDFHLSVASTRDGVGTTINSQLLTGYLMNLCDKAKSGQCPQIPIILLANTFVNVYEPLKRDGRMDFYYWESPLALKLQVAEELFSQYLSKKEWCSINEFVRENQDMPISFFTEIKNDIDKLIIGDLIRTNKKSNIEDCVNKLSNIKSKPMKIDHLEKIAEKRRASMIEAKEGSRWVL